MRRLGERIASSPLSAVLAVVLAMLFSLALPPLSSVLVYVAAAALALHTLQAGALSGARVLGISMAGLAGMVTLALDSGLASPLALVLLLLWVPVWLGAWVLRQTRSLALALLVLSGLGMVLVLLVYAIWGDPRAWWPGWVAQQLATAAELQPELQDSVGSMQEFARRLAPVLAGTLALSLVLNAVLCLSLGRWWQAVALQRTGAVREEFRRLRLNRGLSLAGLAVWGLASVDLGIVSVVALQWALVIMVPFMFIGLAVAHVVLAGRPAGLALLLLVYLVAAVAPQLLAALGLVDPWLDPRRRFGAGRG